MDKLKQYLKVAGKHHFWILCGIVAIITLGSWYTSAAKLTTQFKAKKGKITEAETKAGGVAGTTDHPNKEYQDELDKIINNYKVSLRELWEKQYEGQGKNLQWPVEREDYRGLTPEFVEQVKDLRPIEVVPFDNTGKTPDKLKGNFKEQYRDFVKSTELPRLASIIGATWAPASDNGGGGGGRNNNPDTKETDIVLWNPANQDDLQNFRFDWSREPTKLPSTLQILYAQEDLWVLGTLINIIAKTNEGADARHNAVVKEIKYLRLGTNAVGLSGEVMKLEAAAVPGAVPGAPSVPGAPPGGPPQLPVPGAVPGAVAAVRDPAEGRYVDVDYKPVPPDRLRGASKSNSAADAFLAVAKRMPVRMHLVVDQRYLNRLLAECGNSNLVVEIRQVRLNRPVYEGGAAAGGVAAPRFGPAGGGERGFFTPPPRSSGGNRGGGGGPRGGGGDGRGPNGEEIPHHEVDIELYGIVYIYNPVNEAMVTAVADAGSPAPITAPTTPVPTVPAPAVPPAVNPAAPMNPAAAPVDPAAPVNPAAVPAAPVAPPPAAPMPMPVPPAVPANK
jgi:hypothetical protein